MSALRERTRQFFFRLTSREKFMLIFFIGVLLSLVVAHVLSGYTQHYREYSVTEAELETQELWIDRGPRIRERLDSVLRRLDPEQTFSAPELNARLNEIAESINDNWRMREARSQFEEEFRIHSIPISFRDSRIEDLIAFEARLQLEAPYIGLEQVRISANRGRENLLDADYLVTSFELVDRPTQ
ncbi:MAG: hypothetical protein ACOCVG_05530 [Verrucomicrobiota bacterium]